MEIRELCYKGVFYTLLASGLFEYYSLSEQRLVKADYEQCIYTAIEADLVIL